LDTLGGKKRKGKEKKNKKKWVKGGAKANRTLKTGFLQTGLGKGGQPGKKGGERWQQNNGKVVPSGERENLWTFES